MNSSLTSAKYSWPINEQKVDIQLSGDCEDVIDMSAEDVCDRPKRLSEEVEVESSLSFARPAANGEMSFTSVTRKRNTACLDPTLCVFYGRCEAYRFRSVAVVRMRRDVLNHSIAREEEWRFGCVTSSSPRLIHNLRCSYEGYHTL